MKRYLLIILQLLFINGYSYSQNWGDIFYMDMDAEYLLDEKKYDKAIEIYERILKKVPNSAFVKFKIGITYLKTDDQQNKAISYLEEAVKDVAKDFDNQSISETRAPIEAHLYLGIAYQINNQIASALTSFTNYKGLIDSGNEYYSIVNQYISSCNNAENQLKNPKKIKTLNLGENVNDQNSNFNAVISGDGNTLAYTSYTSNYIDLYISKKSGEQWGKPKNVSEKVSKKYYLKTTGISFDGNTLYLATDDPANNDIYVSTFSENEWANAKKLDKTINGKSNETHASVSKDGKTLYFTSDREGGFGGLDIYKSTLDEKGKWGNAVNLGSKINTPFNEETPFATMDNEYLFFSSQGHTSIGGYDVFYVNLNGEQEVINIGYPINTTANDLFFVPGENINSGYISLFDAQSKGKKDIYLVTITPEIKLNGKIFIDNEIASVESPFTVSVVNTENLETVSVDSTIYNNFSMGLTPGNYKVSIINQGFQPYTQELVLEQGYSKNEYSFEAHLNPIIEDKPVLVAEQIIPPVITEPEVTAVLPVAASTEQTTDSVELRPELVADVVKEEISIPETQPEAIVSPTELPIPKTNDFIVRSENEKKSYSIQIMALKNPVDTDFFANLDHVVITLSPDGFYRYTVGYTTSYLDAVELNERIHQLGYTNAFIKTNSFIPNFTIQLMALKAPVDLNFFKNLPIVSVTKGADEFYRYTFGVYESVSEAKEHVKKLSDLGYKQVFVKKMDTGTHLADK